MTEIKIKSMNKSMSNQQTTNYRQQTIPTLRALLLALCLLTFTSTTTATIRYVSHTGSSTPPYTTWETAADSIQKCIDYSIDGDTIIVANGVYKESLVVNKYLWLWGSSMDSTIIDGTGLTNTTVDLYAAAHLQLFTIKGKGEGTSNTRCIWSRLTNNIQDCKLQNADRGCSVVFTSSIIDRCIITNVNIGCYTASVDTQHTIINNSIIQTSNSEAGIMIFSGGKHTTYNSIILGSQNSLSGIEVLDPIILGTNIIKNNNISAFNRHIDGRAADTAVVHNNVSSYGSQRGFTINSKSDMRNNIVAYNGIGVVGPTSTNSDYNLYWKNDTHTTGGFATNDIVADPMFVNDTIPVYNGSYDYHLQAYSPAINAGDPNILDVDGTRSDIGAYGGPGGQSYIYIDLPPRPPVNVTAIVDSISITIRWNRNTEADTSHYNVYRDTVANFIIDPSKLVSSQTDSFYIQYPPYQSSKYVYKITCVDNQGNESLPSEELIINITSLTMNDYPITINDYLLYQNYPNPFNPSTKIGYKLKERGYVKLMVYDIKGELVSVLVNEVKESGYYEVEFTAEVGSGQYAVGKP